MFPSRWSLVVLSCLLIVLGLSTGAQTRRSRVVYVPYSQAKPILEALAEVLPEGLKNVDSSRQAAVWPEWVARRDAEIRARLARGDEDSLVNFLLFGTSFTRQPRITPQELKRMNPSEEPDATGGKPDAGSKPSQITLARIDDFVWGLVTPGRNERLQFARRVVQGNGINPDTASGRQKAKEYLASSLSRVLREQMGHAQALQAARLLGDPSEEFAARSKLYRERGLSLDTSLLPNFAVEESLRAMLSRGLLRRGSVRRVGIIGPGLDFADKAAGYDFYSQQTIQPLAVMDSLLRLSLARAGALEVTALDISARVNDHLTRARQRAARGAGYTVQLPLDSSWQWKPEAVQYWKRFGDQIGTGVQPAPLPAGIDNVKVRAVRIRPEIVQRVVPADLNIVLQQLAEPAGDGGFDLLIATNIFVYYDVFEQSLALSNVERMLRPGGFLLSNNALLELPSSRMHSVDYLTVVYSDREDDGDHIVWYQRTR